MPFEISINFDYWNKLFALNDPINIFVKLFQDGGWLVFVWLFLRLLIWPAWMNWRQNIFASKQKFIVLALDIPRDNEQSPKAVEHIFSQLAGTFSSGNKVDIYWKGKFQESFSFEIVSNGGYIQFYIHTLSVFRDLVEAAVYAQYPDAIISEVEDYTKPYKDVKFPNTDFQLWGTEMTLVKSDAYPIKTYPLFEHSLSQEFKDPMAGLLEILSRLSPGEQVWLQLVLTPIKGSWTKASSTAINKILGKVPDRNLIDKVVDMPMTILRLIEEAIYPESIEIRKQEAPKSKNITDLTPGDVEAVKAIQAKAGKIGFSTSFRFIYFGLNNVFSKPRGINGVMGALQQYNTLDLNALKPDSKKTTKIDYFFIKTRENMLKNAIFSKYINRSTDGSKMVLNTEELASLYHFPVMLTKPALLSTVSAKRVEAPESLPTESSLLGGMLEDSLERQDAEDDLISALNKVEGDWEKEDSGITNKKVQSNLHDSVQSWEGNEAKRKEPPTNLPI